MATATVPRETKPIPLVTGGPDARNIAVDLVDVADNVRADVGDVSELAESIKHHGVLQPVQVQTKGAGRYLLIFGHRRLAAARQAGLLGIPALVVDPPAGQRVITQLVENLQRADLNPLEEARALRAILDTDPQLTQAELAKRIGRSAPYVSNALRILELDPKVLPLVESGKLTGAHAKALTSLKGKPQRDYAETAIRTGVSAHELERMIQDFHARQKREADEVAALAGWAVAAEQQLLAQGADKKTSTLTTLDGYTWSSEKQLKALKARGWKVHEASWSRGKQCDCSAFGVGVTWEKATRIVRRCIVRAHYEAKLSAEGRKENISWEERQAADNRRRAQYEAIKKGIVDEVTAAFTALPPNVARILLWSLMDYTITDWVRDDKGDRKKPDAWTELLEQDSGALAAEIVGHVFRDLGDRYNVKLDPEAMAEAFGVSLPASRAKKGGPK